MKSIYSLLAASLISFGSIGVANAQTDAQKAEVKGKAVELCQSAAEARYGDNAIKSISNKAKWKKGLNGAAVKMKIKPAKKKASKYSCVVRIDSSVEFYKG